MKMPRKKKLRFDEKIIEEELKEEVVEEKVKEVKKEEPKLEVENYKGYLKVSEKRFQCYCPKCEVYINVEFSKPVCGAC